MGRLDPGRLEVLIVPTFITTAAGAGKDCGSIRIKTGKRSWADDHAGRVRRALEFRSQTASLTGRGRIRQANPLPDMGYTREPVPGTPSIVNHDGVNVGRLWALSFCLFAARNGRRKVTQAGFRDAVHISTT